MNDDKINAACTRLLRNITICQLALAKPTVAAMAHIQAAAVLSAAEGLLDLLTQVDGAQIVTPDAQIIGPHTAELLAESQGAAPDHIPNDWT